MLSIEETANVIEGILFLSPNVVNVKDLSQFLKVDREVVEEAMRVISARQTGGLELLKTAGGYELATRAECIEHLRAFFGGMDRARLSRAALETLAIIAYRQPISRGEIESIRGVNSQGVARSLLDRGLIRISGKGDGIGRPYLFSTTQEFLRFIGLDKLEDLPPIESFEQKT